MSSAPATATDAVTKPDRIAALRSALPADLSHSPLLGIFAVIMGAGLATSGRTSPFAGPRRSPRAHRHRRRRGRVDRHRVQRRHDVHRTADRVPRRAARRAARPPGLQRRVRDRLGVPAVRPQLQRVDRPAGDCRSQLRDLLPADAQLRAAEHSAQVPGAHARPVCDVYRGRRELCALAVRLLSGSPVVGRGCSGRPRSSRRSWWRACTTAFRRPRGRRPSGPTPSFAGFLYASAGLALLFAALDQGQRLDWWRSGVFTALVRDRDVLAAVRDGPPPAPAKSAGRSAVPAQVEHARPGIRLSSRSASCCWRRPWSSRRRWPCAGLDAAQFGPAVLWTAVPELCLAFFAAHLLNKGLDSRLLMAMRICRHGHARA